MPELRNQAAAFVDCVLTPFGQNIEARPERSELRQGDVFFTHSVRARPPQRWCVLTPTSPTSWMAPVAVTD